jgi:fructose transport system ATP-binding protein
VFRQGLIAGVLNAKEASGNDVVAMITGLDQGIHDNASYI